MYFRKIQKSFSILEFIVALFIGALILVLVVTAFVSFKSSSALNQAVQVVASSLRTARIRTVSSQDLSSWGVHFATNSEIVIFKGLVFSATGSANEVNLLPGLAIISSLALNSATYDVVFLRPQGITSNYGTVTIALKNSSSSRVIRIDEAGAVSVDTEAPPLVVNSNQDTRHVHVALGFDIRTKSNLVLTFHDPPNPDIVDTVSVESCLIQADVLDCTRLVDVYGSTQTIRVNTHYLDPSTTNLSINRDLRKNNKPVDISFDTVLIVSYNTSSSVIKGPDVLVGEPQIQ